MAFLVLGANSVSGYTVKNSLRFNSGSSDYLKRIPASSGNRQTWTYSAWIKKSKIGASGYEYLFNCTDNSTSTGRIMSVENSTDSFNFTDDLIGVNLTTTAVHRDPSAWYHLVVVLNTTNATSTNRVKMYVNGSEITAFSTATYPSQNGNGSINLVSGSYAHHIGTYIGGQSFFNGYMSEINFIDGTALTPSSFGETDTDTGIWKPKAYTGTYGTNGFYLKFANSASLGTDSSGNGNTFTVNNLTSIDQTTDTPTNNFATGNPLETQPPTYSEGNLKGSIGATAWKSLLPTIAVSKGKWYAEFKVNSASYSHIGVVSVPDWQTQATGYIYFGDMLKAWSYRNDGKIYNNGGINDTETSYTSGDLISVALDCDNNKIYFAKNGTWQNAGVPASGTNGYSITADNLWYIGFNIYDADISVNFGNPPYTANGYTDGAGYGNFSYAVPSGYYSLCTRNLANFG
jgi:hypothetical protein